MHTLPDTSLSLEIFKLALPFGAAVAGWFVASRLQDKRERRKEIRGLIDEVKKIINDNYKLVLQYYSSENKSPINALSAEIKFKNLLISQYFLVIGQAGMPILATQEIINFSQLSTGGVFETPQYTSKFEDASWRAEFMASAQDLAILLDKRYFDTFRIRGMTPRFQFSEMGLTGRGWSNEPWF